MSGEEGSEGEGREGEGGEKKGLGKESGEEEEKSKEKKKSYGSIGEDGMSRSRSFSGERSGKRTHTLSPSPSRPQGGGMGERKGCWKPGVTGGQEPLFSG